MMKHAIAFDATRLSRSLAGHRAPLWWGVLGLILIESIVVASFIASYFYLRVGAWLWPPPGVLPPDLSWPTINTALLLSSAATMWLSSQAMIRGQRWLFSFWVAVSLLFAGMVLVLRWMQFGTLGFRWDSHAYGSLVWSITGFHFILVVSAVIGTVAVWVLSLAGYFGGKLREHQHVVVANRLYWYFICAAWIPIYVLLYWAPHAGV